MKTWILIFLTTLAFCVKAQDFQGKAFYTGLKGLGEMIFEDYETNRKKRIKG